MGRYLLRRLKLAVITILGVTVIVFVASRLSGDVVFLILPQDASEAEVAAMRAKLGLDQPLWVQYWRFLVGLAQGEFGESIRYQQPAMPLVLERIPATLELALAAFLLAGALGIASGIAAARWRNSWIDGVIRLVAVLGQAMPTFWTGLMAILFFAVWLGWLPTSGRQGPSYLVLPAITLSLFTMAAVMRMTRSAMLENLDTEYVKFLRAKGVPERVILWKHALRNSLVPVVALTGVQVANLLGGAVITEAVFAWPGLGSLIVEAINSRDYPLIQAGVLITSMFLITLNLLVDLLFGVIDPRVRYE